MYRWIIPRFKDRKHERFEKQIYGAGDRALREERRRGRRPVRGRRRASRRGGGHGDELRHAAQRSHGACRGFGHSRRLRRGEGFQAGGVRNLLLLRTVPDVPERDLLGWHPQDLFRQYARGRQADRLRRFVYLRPDPARPVAADGSLRGDDARRGVAGLPAVGAEGGQGRVLNLRRLPVHGVGLRHAGASGVRPSAEVVGVRAAVGTAARNTLAEVSFRGLRSAAFLAGGNLAAWKILAIFAPLQSPRGFCAFNN